MPSNHGPEEIPLAARRSNWSILREINPKYSLEGLMLTLKLQYFGHLMRRTDSLEETLMQRKIEGKRRMGWQRTRWLDGITNWWTWVWPSFRRWWWTGKLGMLQSMGSQRVGHDWATELNWTDQSTTLYFPYPQTEVFQWKTSLPLSVSTVFSLNYKLIAINR